MKKGPFRYMYLYLILNIIFFIFSCKSGENNLPQRAIIPPKDPGFTYIGRFEYPDSTRAVFGWSASEIRCTFEGPYCKLLLENESSGNDPDGSLKTNYYRVQIDTNPPIILKADNRVKEYLLADSLSPGAHTLSVFRRTEAEAGPGIFRGLVLAPGSKLLAPEPVFARKLEFIGNSITCGYGNEGEDQDCKFSCATENAWEAFPAITARNLQAEFSSVCYSGRGVIQNYNRSRTGTMPQLYDRIYPQSEQSWEYETSTPPDVVVLNLGTNDFAHENPDREKFTGVYRGFLETIKGNYPDAVIICLTGPMMTNSGERRQLATLKSYLDEAIEGMGNSVVRFDLTTQGPLGYGCDWHPNIAQNHLNADELSGFIKEKMGW